MVANQPTPQAIEALCGLLGISIDALAAQTMSRYAQELIKWNRRTNLSGAATIEAFIAGPLFDALTLVPVLERRGTLVDIGSGGGLPAIPVCILFPEITPTMVEPRAKRASFLRHVLQVLSLTAEVIEQRDETVRDRTWSGAVAQAVWPPIKWVERASHLVTAGGVIYVLSSAPISANDLPAHAAVERQVQMVRPADGKQRHSTRIRISV